MLRLDGSILLIRIIYDQPGLLRVDPLSIKPEDPEELDLMITPELQNGGRLVMLAAAGFLAQEAVDGHLVSWSISKCPD